MSKIDFFENSIQEVVDLLKTSQIDFAQKRLNALIKKNDHFYLYYLQGLIYLQTEKNKDAIESFAKSIELQPSFPEAHNGLGTTYMKLNYVTKAISFFKQSILLNNNFIQARLNLVNAYLKIDKYIEAEKQTDQILLLESDNNHALNLLADIKNKLLKSNEAIEIRTKILESINSAEQNHMLGTDYMSVGNLNNALIFYQKSLAIEKTPYVFYKISQLYSYSFTPEDIEFLNNFFENSNDVYQKIHAGFALSAIYKKNKKYANSYEFLCKSNQLKDSISIWNKENFEDYLIQIQSQFKYLKRNNICLEMDTNKTIPIFILGLPRSGSTLTEQIISNHPDIYAAGEVGRFGRIYNSFVNKNTILTSELLGKIRETYLTELKDLSNKNYITDKTPGNFVYTGILSIVFPEAIFIHTQRNLFDSAFSIYENNFEDPRMGWAFNHENITSYVQLYINTMNFWQSENLNNFFNLSYEGLVEDPEKSTQKLFDFLGLDFSTDLLDITKNSNPVYTASAVQVRSKINKNAINKWNKYGDVINSFKKLIDEINV